MRARMVLAPRPGVHVDKRRRLPVVLGMSVEEGLGFKIASTGMSDARHERHVFRHLAVHDFSLHRAEGVVGSSLKIRIAFGSVLAVAAQRAAIRPGFLG